MDHEDLGWAVLELMGHIRLGGYITEEERFGSKIGRIDIHGEQGVITTQYFGGSSVYRITPTTEAIAKAIGARSEAPIQRWELKALEAPQVQQIESHCENCGRTVFSGEDVCDTCSGNPDDDETEEMPF